LYESGYTILKVAAHLFLLAFSAFNVYNTTTTQVGFYGVDVYSLHTSIRKVVDFLREADPKAADRISARYACFDRFGEDPQQYALAAGMGLASCAEDAVAALRTILAKRSEYASKMDGEFGQELAFAAACDAAVVVGAEAYYSQMFFKEESTWNLRSVLWENGLPFWGSGFDDMHDMMLRSYDCIG
jgi:erythromycin esterase-like protein